MTSRRTALVAIVSLLALAACSNETTRGTTITTTQETSAAPTTSADAAVTGSEATVMAAVTEAVTFPLPASVDLFSVDGDKLCEAFADAGVITLTPEQRSSLRSGSLSGFDGNASIECTVKVPVPGADLQAVSQRGPALFIDTLRNATTTPAYTPSDQPLPHRVVIVIPVKQPDDFKVGDASDEASSAACYAVASAAGLQGPMGQWSKTSSSFFNSVGEVTCEADMQLSLPVSFPVDQAAAAAWVQANTIPLD